MTDFWMPTKWTRLADKRMEAHQTLAWIRPLPLTKHARQALKDRRLALGVSMKTLSARVGVGHDSIRDWERGRAVPYRRNLIAWENALSEMEWEE